jgi:3-hydroxymyristoyl/3-hydroxydecanoyl-(acyl carrier protein) dehydratase
MKFRMVDRILACSEMRIRTRKTVSFEEFSLLKPWGRKGTFPETLVLQVAVESASLLAAYRSGQTRIGVLEWVEDLRFAQETRPGAVLDCEVNADQSDFEFRIEVQGSLLASGRLGLRELPLAETYDPAIFALQWEAIHAAS